MVLRSLGNQQFSMHYDLNVHIIPHYELMFIPAPGSKRRAFE